MPPTDPTGHVRPTAAFRVLPAALGGGTALWAVAGILTTAGLVRTPASGFLLVVCLALLILGLPGRTVPRESAAWAALSLLGWALALQLVDAGPAVKYQHLRPAVAPLTREDVLILGALGAQALVVAYGLSRHAAALRAWFARHLGGWRAVFVLGGLVALSASPLKDLAGYALELGLSTAFALVALGSVVLFVLSLPRATLDHVQRQVDRLLGPVEGRPGRDRLALLAAVFTTLVSAALAFWIWERHPHISDEASFLFQARYFATGSLVAPGVPVPEAFAAYQIECSTTRCLSVLQPGWPALLSLGVRAGAAWLVNPLLAGLNVLLAFALLRALYGPRFARGATLLLAASPWYLFLGMSLMTHQATLTGGLIGALGATFAYRGRAVAWAAVAGLGAGFASLIRPLDGVIVASLVGTALLLGGTPRRRLTALALFVTGAALLGSLNLAYNHAVTGDPLDFPVTSYVNELWGEGTNNLGFGPDRGVYPLWAHMDGFPGHSPFQAVVNSVLNLTAIQFDLFGWAVGSLLPILLLLAWREVHGRDRVMLTSIAAIVALYSLYWFASGPDFAARYWFLAIVPLVVLTARGLSELARRLGAGGRPGAARVGAALALLSLQGLFVFVPWRSTDKYYRYVGTGPMIREVLQAGAWPPGIYLVRGSNQPDYSGAMTYGAPDLAGGDMVFAFDSLPDTGARLLEAFPDRRVWLVDGPTLTGDVYRIVGTVERPRRASPEPPKRQR